MHSLEVPLLQAISEIITLTPILTTIALPLPPTLKMKEVEDIRSRPNTMREPITTIGYSFWCAGPRGNDKVKAFMQKAYDWYIERIEATEDNARYMCVYMCTTPDTCVYCVCCVFFVLSLYFFLYFCTYVNTCACLRARGGGMRMSQQQNLHNDDTLSIKEKSFVLSKLACNDKIIYPVARAFGAIFFSAYIISYRYSLVATPEPPKRFKGGPEIQAAAGPSSLMNSSKGRSSVIRWGCGVLCNGMGGVGCGGE